MHAEGANVDIKTSWKLRVDRKIVIQCDDVEPTGIVKHQPDIGKPGVRVKELWEESLSDRDARFRIAELGHDPNHSMEAPDEAE